MVTRRFSASAVLITMWLWSCASAVRQADDLFDAGEYPQAARAYEAYLASNPVSGPATSRALYRLAVTHGSAGSPTYDPERSIALLERLLKEDPDGEFSLAAEVMLQLRREIARLSNDVASRRELIQALIADLSGLQDHLERTESEVGEKTETLQALSERIELLRREIARLSRQLSEREAELEQLKEIDLEVPPF